jgi:hypothetical protein
LHDLDPEPELEVMNPDPAPELGLNYTKIHKKYQQSDNNDIKNTLIFHFY